MYYGGYSDQVDDAVIKEEPEFVEIASEEPVYEEVEIAETVEAEPELELVREDAEDIYAEEPAPDLEDDPVLNELVYGEFYDDVPPVDEEYEPFEVTESADDDVMDPADDGSSDFNKSVSASTGVNAFNSLTPEQQAKILDADYEDDY